MTDLEPTSVTRQHRSAYVSNRPSIHWSPLESLVGMRASTKIRISDSVISSSANWPAAFLIRRSAFSMAARMLLPSGAWIFRGTRVPVSALFENLEGGATLDQFLEWFPGVTRRQAESVLEHAAQSVQAA
jgi:uncharacterized protein (DUF433 family)